MQLLTPQEYVDRGKEAYKENPVSWVHGLDLLDHVLQGDHQKTIFGNPQNEHLYYVDSLRDSLQNRAKADDEFQEIVDNSYQPKKRWQRRMEDCGDLDLDSYLNREEFPFESWEKTVGQGHALSIILDGTVTYGDRKRNYMQERHKEVYSIVAQCEAERRPVRVIAVQHWKIPETRWGIVVHFIVIKDYDDPIFPGIWGAFMSNPAANDLVNCVQSFYVGTGFRANGMSGYGPISLRHYLPDDEEIIIFGNLITE